MDKNAYIDKALAWVKKKPCKTLKAKSEGYEDPKIFTSQSTQEQIQADFSFITPKGAKHFTEIALKTDKPQKLVSRWKLLSLMASLKNGQLNLLAPRGHKSFIQKLVREYNIQASVYSL